MSTAANSIADVNNDGHLDIVFSNNSNGSSSEINSFVYWGPTFAVSKRLELPTLGAMENAAADFDKDGFVDLLFVNSQNNTTNKVNSYVYMGGAAGFLPKNRREIPSIGSHGQAIADLNGDWFLDVVISNSPDNSAHVYQGSSKGFTKVDSCSGKSPIGVTIADLDNKGGLDVVLNNHYDGITNLVNAYIYWNGKASLTKLPVVSAHGSVVADWDRNGYLDIAFSHSQNASNFNVNSYLYWNSSSGYGAVKPKTQLPTSGARFSLFAEPGSVYTRKPIQYYTSRKFDTALTSPICSKLTVAAWVPPRTNLDLQVRSATTTSGLDTANWYGATGKGTTCSCRTLAIPMEA